jgi:hypothetical protein
MPRTSFRSYAILWLVVIHVLADVAVSVYRTQDVNRELTDIISAALTRGQICLLAMWMAAGADPLSWRLCGFLGGVSFVFVIFTRTALPGQYGAGAGAVWLDEEWAYYFRLSAPGDLLLKAPVMIVLVAAPLLLLRLGRLGRLISRGALAPGSGETGNQETEPDASASRLMNARRRMQFGLAEASLWVVTLSMTFAAVFRTAPYPEWFEELAAHWRERWRFPNDAAVYAIAGGAIYALTALASLWLVYGKLRLWLRLPLFLALVVGPSYASELWLQRIVAQRGQMEVSEVWGLASSEIWTSAAAASFTVASIILYRLYGPQSHVGPGPVQLRASRGADRAASAP